MAEAPREFLDGRVVLHPGDCLEVLARLPADSVERWTTEIVVSGLHGQIELLGGSAGGARRPPPPAGEADYGGSGNGGRAPASGSGAEPPFDDEIPF